MTVPEQIARMTNAQLAAIARDIRANIHLHQCAIRELELRADRCE